MLVAAKLACAKKTKSPSLPRNVALETWRTTNSVLNKGKSAVPPLFYSSAGSKEV